jgi:multisite-specific tRNA:(cytosine-C5)-methyltransferase
MGRKWGRNGQGYGGRDAAGDAGSGGKSSSGGGERFEAFYQAQQIVSTAEWPELMASLETELPCSFRVCSSSHAAASRSAAVASWDGDRMATPTAVGWLPKGYAFETTVAGERLKAAAPGYHRWLTEANASGRVNRQELVSMIPPLLLAPHAGHKVIDMCAAPGSKTAQLVESLLFDKAGGAAEGGCRRRGRWSHSAVLVSVSIGNIRMDEIGMRLSDSTALV